MLEDMQLYVQADVRRYIHIDLTEANPVVGKAVQHALHISWIPRKDSDLPAGQPSPREDPGCASSFLASFRSRIDTDMLPFCRPSLFPFYTSPFAPLQST